ncbi:LacI family DNA-binding transcriptional regulator [Lactobacillus pentosus]|jgi:DNA-binding LacI/PurR family transcriptional regulator|uniref:LacI family DNA-binding transcriptional regulator n=2 Tax=Lactiplantibacillus pentosus TaxID=1589 RepID=A0A2S9WBQ0_LACPE|nr:MULTISPECIES: LacI family DNA-binding transcriptional regulator [Lactiplantibacillus]BBM21566.1 transcription regulator, LacI family, maltose related protein [Lactiplantibacillus plantarum]MBO9164346.1 LacI family DNA-binding transcriptional regulator [Lactiplantibacillus pentosus]MBQ0835600.1 LacI family DNA-binding transcriptional regulator [Lactiplantibacillus pentosus]MBU7464213.1 LacI family DNA-binding transcriptional regulator [Lactiplantibacillus pentosus]MBU7472532.1 LacI family DN
MITLNDVAKKANVSKMTVSRVINHPDQVRPELRELILDVMAQLNYQPNAAARALVGRRTRVIKLTIFEDMDTTEPYYMMLLAGISNELNQHQYALQIATRNSFQNGECDGYILTGIRQTDYAWVSRLTQPVVFFGSNRQGYDYVDTDNYQAVQESTKYAVETGYTHLVFIGIAVAEPFELDRERGFREYVTTHRISAQIIRLENHSHTATAYVKAHWRNFPRNTAFVCASDRLAIGVETAIISEGGQVPTEYGVIGFDGVLLNQIATKRLTTMQQPLEAMGRAAARLLLANINHGDTPRRDQEKVIINSRLSVAESTR